MRRPRECHCASRIPLHVKICFHHFDHCVSEFLLADLPGARHQHIADPSQHVHDVMKQVRELACSRSTAGICRVELDAFVAALIEVLHLIDAQSCVDVLHLRLLPVVKSPVPELSLQSIDVLLPSNAAIPCGLVVNELISNALKHAFPGERTGEIKIDLSHESATMVVLSVCADGVGIPENFPIEETATLGLQLVTMLTDSWGAS
jgi:signal transduction histidine kinase